MAEPGTIAEYREVARAYRALKSAVRKVRPDADIRPIRAAYRFARAKHAAQRRKSGELYITHPLAVALVLAELEMDTPTICAGLLHDVVEDTAVTPEEMVKRFGAEVAALVDGVTKLKIAGMDEFNVHSPEQQSAAEPDKPLTAHEEARSAHETARAQKRHETVKSAANLRKIFLAMAKDLRVTVIKLADRLHNMRTLDSMPEQKRKRIAEETLHIFAPLAHRLGIWQMKWELEDLAFKYVEPEEFKKVATAVAQTRTERQDEVDEAIRILKERLAAEGIPDVQINGRPKHLWSIYQKMLKQELDFKELFDLIALRIIVHTKAQCYHALGIVSSLWPPMPGMFSDYIARSKGNMYQSLHIKVIGPHGKPLEIQIRTWEMHRTAEFGVAAHWAYKEKGEGGRVNIAGGDQFERKLAWLRQQIFDMQAEAREPGEFLRSVTEDLFTDQVFAFSPRGDVMDMPAGATPIDFAFRVHSDVGQKCVGAKVNGKMVPLSYQLRNGDVVEIVTRSDGHPSRDWLALAKTAHAKSKIKAYFKRLLHDESVQQGREMLQKEVERLGLDSGLVKEEALKAVAAHFNVPNEVELLAAIGYGTVSIAAVLNRLSPSQPLPPKGLVVGKGRADDRKLKVSAGSIDNVAFRRARCCLPIPGDEVIGYVTRGRGMALHRRECINIKHYEKTEPERLTAVDYTGGGENQVYSVNLVIETADRTGLLADVGNIFGEMKTFITAIKTQSHRDHTATLEVAAEVKDVEHLNRLFLAVRRLPDVLDIERAIGGREK
jgi:guanosine-3',5'-bis(diphosphate) 3'-pyrophosphohydrolase